MCPCILFSLKCKYSPYCCIVKQCISQCSKKKFKCNTHIMIFIQKPYSESYTQILFIFSQKKLEKHNRDVLRDLRSLFKYCQGVAHVWDVHELGLAKTERALQEKLDECRRKHDNENQVCDGFAVIPLSCHCFLVDCFR